MAALKIQMFPNSETTKGFITDHFRKRRVPLTEEAILEAIMSWHSKHDVYWSVLALRDIGTERCIPVLKGLLHYPMQDVKDCSLLTIAHIPSASETGFYLEALADKRSRKLYPMWAIEVAADERAIPAVLEFVSTALRKASRPADVCRRMVDRLKVVCLSTRKCICRSIATADRK